MYQGADRIARWDNFIPIIDGYRVSELKAEFAFLLDLLKGGCREKNVNRFDRAAFYCGECIARGRRFCGRFATATRVQSAGGGRARPHMDWLLHWRQYWCRLGSCGRDGGEFWLRCVVDQ